MKTDDVVLPKQSLAAIEIGTEWVKVLQVDRKGRAPAVSRLSVRRVDELGENPGAELGRWAKSLNLASGPVVACLPRQLVNIRLFELPSSDPQEIADMIDLQVGHQTPYARDEIVIDYRLFRAQRAGYTRVMLVIAQSAVVRQRFRWLEEAGLTVGLMTVGTEGVINRLGAGAGCTMVLDVDAACTEILVVQDGNPLFTRNLAVGALALGDPAGIDRFVQEIQRSVEAYRGETAGAAAPEKVCLAGAGNLPAALDERLSGSLGVGVERVTALEAVAGDGVRDMSQPQAQAVSWTGLAGVALQAEALEVNLTPESVSRRRALAAQARNLTVFGVLVMAVLALVSLWVLSRFAARQDYVSALERRVAATERDANEMESMKRKVTLVAARLGTGLVPVSVLAELQRLTPAEVCYAGIQVDNGTDILLRGTAETVSDILKFATTLEAAPLFRNAKTTRTTTGKGGKTEFEIACTLEAGPR